MMVESDYSGIVRAIRTVMMNHGSSMEAAVKATLALSRLANAVNSEWTNVCLDGLDEHQTHHVVATVLVWKKPSRSANLVLIS